MLRLRLSCRGRGEVFEGVMGVLDGRMSAFIDAQRVARLATADGDGRPHVLPVCFALGGDTVYVAIDEKPKRAEAARLKRLRNIAENPSVAVVFDRYDDDWSRLAWVLLRGRARIIAAGDEHAAAVRLLRDRYEQYRGMALEDRPVIAIDVERVAEWGNLA